MEWKPIDEAGWKPIKGYKYPYRINEEARVQKFDGKKWIDLSTHLHKGSLGVKVWLRDKNNKERYESLTGLMADAFMGGRRAGYNIIHKNSFKEDCSLENLEFISNKANGKMFGGLARRLPVLKVDRNGEILAVYKSAEEAAKDCFLSKLQVQRHCRKEIQNPFKFLDYTFMYDK